MSLRPSLLVSLAIASAALALTTADAQEAVTAPMGGDVMEARIDSGMIQATGRETEQVLFQSHVHEPGAAWIRLQFDDVRLPGSHNSGTESVLRLTSMLDGAVQELDAIELLQWQNSSAYFNGDTVLIEVVNRGTPGIHHFRMSEFIAGPDAGVPAEVQRSICLGTDDRELSNDPRVARIAPIGCTGWIIDDCNNCFLTAGHCTGSGSQVVQFNVPLSNPNGSWNNPHPDDQYPIDQSSMQSNGGQGVGNDWAYFGAFPNSNTGLRPVEAQGSSFQLIAPPPVSGQPIRITGYGTVSSPVPGTWNSVQKTHVGPFAIRNGNRIGYTTDTTGGNSGSPVILESTGQAIGIHTHGGCNSGGGANNGTSYLNPGLQDALANPQGICCAGEPEPPSPFSLLSPADGAEGIERNPVVRWEAAENTWYYRISMADNPEFVNAVVDGFTTANTQINLPPNYLDEGTTYYWQVEALATNGLIRMGDPALATFTTVGSLLPCPGDTDGSGSIDLADLNAVLAAFGTTGEGVLPGDADGNGSVDLADLNLVLAAFGSDCP